MSSDDLARLFAPTSNGSMSLAQGTVVAWDPATGENIIDWRGVQLVNLPIIASTRAMVFSPGESVALIGSSPTGGRGVGTWCILGLWIIPGGTEDSEALFDTISAREINVERLNVDELFVDGQTALEAVEESAPPAVGTIKTTYTASWSAAYRGNNARNTFDERPVQGFFSSTNGNQRALVGFPSSVQSDHSGRTITRVRVWLYYAHWYYNSGGTSVLGHHGHSSPPSSFSATTDVQRSANWPKNAARWRIYTHSMQQWATGAKRGVAIGPGPTTNRLYYGRARGHGESKPPRLEIISEA